ncbi:MAG: leucine-rich repeat domain-containing protein, partial [Clostridia bacterium]|nr:leucine-rich repeat domain-containing protein [Clostridia bacterium]
LTFIGKGAFSGCTAAENVTIGKKVEKIGVDAFAGTPWFENWEADEETNLLVVGDGVLIKVSAGAEINDSDAKVISAKIVGDEIPEGKFYDKDNWYTVVIPGTVKSIGDNAFYYSDNLFEVIVEEGVESIGSAAFYSCKNLTRVTLPSTLKTIGDYAFYGCADLTEIVIPENVTEIGKMAFYNCLSLKDVTVPASVSEIGAYAFTNTFWRENDGSDYMIAGDGILIRYNLFENATVITDAIGIKKIAGGAFAETYRLAEITLPESITELPEFAFSSCNTLVKITAKGVATVGPRAFNNCTKLTTVDFADGYTADADAFNGCTMMNGASEEPTEITE